MKRFRQWSILTLYCFLGKTHGFLVKGTRNGTPALQPSAAPEAWDDCVDIFWKAQQQSACPGEKVIRIFFLNKNFVYKAFWDHFSCPILLLAVCHSQIVRPLHLWSFQCSVERTDAVMGGLKFEPSKTPTFQTVHRLGLKFGPPENRG